jgi:secreted trypsin-like serine protease
MIKRIVLATGLGAGLLSGCSGIDDGSGTPEPTAMKQDAITGGEIVGENVEPYSSTVRILGGVGSCSGVKIGNRRFLTAAHCISLLDPKTATGARVTITNSLNGLGGTIVNVDRFYPHPTYWWSLSAGVMAKIPHLFDIALLDVQSDTPSIPAAVTDTSGFGDGWLGTLVGYGCDNRTDIVSTNGGKKQTAEFAAATLAEFQTGYTAAYPHSATYQHYIISDGVPRYPGAPAGFFRQSCPGDSGGPMFGWNNGWKVAGITSHGFPGNGPLAPTAQFSFATRVASVSGWLGAAKKIKGERGSITNALTGKCLGVEGNRTQGAPIVQELCSDRTSTNNSQYWTKEDTGGGNVRFVNGLSGMCMHALATSIVQQPCNPARGEQNFRIHAASPTLTPLISSNGGYAAVEGVGTLYYGSVNVKLGGDEATTRMRWVWTP